MKWRSRIERQGVWVFLRYLLRHSDATPHGDGVESERGIQRWLFGRVAENASPQVIRQKCRDLFCILDVEFDGTPFYPDTLRHVAERFGLDEAERHVLWLGVLIYECRAFRDAMCSFESDLTRSGEAAHIIARMTHTHFQDVLPAIGPSGHLVEIGLVEPVMHYGVIEDYLNITHRVLQALTQRISPDKVMDALLRPARPGTLQADDFPHLQNDFHHVCRYLRSVGVQNTHGVNVLFYGIPGTGKTEFASLIARHLSIPLYVIPEDQPGSRYSERDLSRLAAYRMTQALLSSTTSLILFDDVEDGLLDWERHVWTAKTSGKALINTLLETNPVPAIWVTNVACRFDTAHLRRFDLVVGFKTPPRSVRVSMIDKHLHALPLSPLFKSTLADDRDLTPAQIGTIARVVGNIARDKPDAGDMDSVGVHLHRSAYKLRFAREPESAHDTAKSIEFDADWVNTSIPVRKVMDLFRESSGLTACFHGLPGTGKSALARHIARILDKPVLFKRASDLLRPFLGETEMQLRTMFEEALDEGAMLLLDEADSFLADRTGAKHVWEVQQVNELLTQIERFRGHFIATTNAFDALDLASLRRFDVKVCFDPLCPSQRVGMFNALIERLGVVSPEDPPTCPPDIVTALHGMSQLTPGDFAVVSRKLGLTRIPVDVACVLDALSEEHRYKQHLGRAIGFLR